MAILGVFGGSGVYALRDLQETDEIDVPTPFGKTSGNVKRGRIGDTTILFLPRHGAGHQFSPSDLPYRANVYAMKALGATHLLSFSAVGSLREAFPPRSLLIPDQVIDRTVLRPRTFFDNGVVAHVGIADPFCTNMQVAIDRAAHEAGERVSMGGAYLCIEGPQFSTRAESVLYRSWGASVIGMTAMPEARLAREAELCFAVLAMVTDYDVWHDSEEDVTVQTVVSHMQANAAAASAILRGIAETGLPERTCACATALDNAIMTDPRVLSPDTKQRIQLLVGNRLDSE